MQGIWINGSRPKSKKAVREALATAPETVHIEATSWHGDEFDGTADSLDAPAKVAFVGPCPHTKRNFYGTATRSADGTWSVV